MIQHLNQSIYFGGRGGAGGAGLKLTVVSLLDSFLGIESIVGIAGVGMAELGAYPSPDDGTGISGAAGIFLSVIHFLLVS